jgi:transposase
MERYAGLDVSLKEISICVVDDDGRVVHRSTVMTDPDAVAQHFAEKGIKPDRLVHESGQLSIWLQRGLLRRGLPAECIDARLAHKALSARLNKSDRADAEGLAQLARTGWYTPVHIRSEDADRLRTLIAARERLVRLRKDLEGHVRGILKTFGIRISAVGTSRLCEGFREQLAAAGETDPTLAMIADGFCAAHETLCTAAEALTDDLKAIARRSRLARRLMTVPGVGPIVALNFIALVDDPKRFRSVSAVGAFLGLTP